MSTYKSTADADSEGKEQSCQLAVDSWQLTVGSWQLAVVSWQLTEGGTGRWGGMSGKRSGVGSCQFPYSFQSLFDDVHLHMTFILYFFMQLQELFIAQSHTSFGGVLAHGIRIMSAMDADARPGAYTGKCSLLTGV